MTTSILGDTKIASLLAMAADVRARGVAGAVAEVGVYRGGVLRELSAAFPDRDVYGYDTFAGMPIEHWQPDEIVAPGSFGDGASLAEVRAALAGCGNVTLCPGLFPASGIDVPYAFVHLDVDMYQSTRAALEWLSPRMARGGVIVLDDWDWPQCPGVRRAVARLGLRAVRTCTYQARLAY